MAQIATALTGKLARGFLVFALALMARGVAQAAPLEISLEGKTRFVRLEHSNKYWDKNFGAGADNNLLIDYAARHAAKNPERVAKESESVTFEGLGFELRGYLPAFQFLGGPAVLALKNLPAKKSPPLVYIGGTDFTPTAEQKKILKEYLIEKHGMILGDNLGGEGFHKSFIAVMNEVTGIKPVEIPMDDPIHSKPYDVKPFPFVVVHDRNVPLGWKIDGRWVVYYHPGALSDGWRDDRAGIKKDVAELCILLGHNILFYSQREYGRWLRSQQP